MRCLNIAIISFALLLRILVGFHPHSGQDDYQGPNNNAATTNGGATKRPKYGGDYEAQRHWMEITYHLPISEWYHHDLEYWGLDYPPLTAYVSWVCGWVAHTVGSIHDRDDNGVCKWDDSICIDQRQKNNTTGSGTTTSKSSPNKGLGVLKELVALYSSRWGFEESGGKLYMRFTVLVCDLLVYMSAVWVLVARLTKEVEEEGGVNTTSLELESTSANKNDDAIIPMPQRRRVWLLLTALSQPALLLVDHGHFQYNTVSLGLALWSFHFMTMNTSKTSSTFVGPILGSILFTLALNFKQMELYHAPAIFAYLLGRCFRSSRGDDDDGDKPNTQTDQSAVSRETVGKFCALGATVILTFSLLWLPFAIYPRGRISPSSPTFHLDGILQVVRRLFPFSRGIFEGKVANVWCALSIKPFSIRDRVPNELLPSAALGLTLALIVPPCWILFMAGKDESFAHIMCVDDGDKSTLQSNQTRKRKQKDGSDIRLLLWGTASTSLAFFLASFQVHEKGILIPLAPLSLLAIDAPRFVSFFSILATWSLWPLLVIDRLGDAYVCCLVIFLCVDSVSKVSVSELPHYGEDLDIFSDGYITKYVPTLSWLIMIALHFSELAIAPPHHLPDLYPVLWSFVGCGLFCTSYVATLWAMVMQTKSKKMIVKRQKLSMKRVVKSKNSILPISVLGVLALSYYADTSEAFCSRLPCHHYKVNDINRLHSSGKDCICDIITEDLLERARLPLSWEVQSARESRPVLDLSGLVSDDNLSLGDAAGEYMSPTEVQDPDEDIKDDDGQSWEDGRVWQETEQQLMDMDLLTNGDDKSGKKLTSRKVLTKAPQLLRLPTPQIVEAATYLLSYQNSTALVEMDPSLLTYRADDLQHGLEEYLPNMMFRGNQTLAAQMIQTQLALSPTMALQIVRMGVAGGMEERQVSRALGNAGSASGKAAEGVVGEMGRSYKEWKRVKGGKGSLG